ncbi:MAG: hypothetical protein JWP56_90, partial [Aeromicrobium sp.]|nr:hypothetical protein [Aeromicrobium sp.]
AIHADPVDPMPTHEEHALLGSLPVEAVDRLLEAAGPEADCPQVIVELRQLGGAIAAGSRIPSAFCSRDAAYSLLTIGIGVPPVVEAVREQAAQLLASMRPWTTSGGLPNFAPRTGAAWLRRVYDPAVLERLRRLAHAYDPEQVILGARALHEGEVVTSRARAMVRRLTTRR